MSKQSMRQIASELGISPAYLSYMLNGKRPWRKDLYQRYTLITCVLLTLLLTVRQRVLAIKQRDRHN